MAVLTPEPINRERARKDIGYFAEKYLDITLSERQVKCVDTILHGKPIDVAGLNREEKQALIDVSVAIATNRGIPIITRKEGDREIIDV